MKRMILISVLLVMALLAPSTAETALTPLEVLRAYLAGDDTITVEQAREAVEHLTEIMEEQPEALTDLQRSAPPEAQEGKPLSYVLNVRTHRFHRPDCTGIREMAPKNRLDYYGSRELLVETGFEPCKICCP